MEKPKDKDFVKTEENFLFCLIGYLHPRDRYTAYLKYVPHPEGKWGRKDLRFSRVVPYYHVSQIEKTYEYLGMNHPGYIFDCPIRNITVSSVPLRKVKKIFRPRTRLKKIITEGYEDPLEKKLTELVEKILDYSGLKIRDVGITGSILTGIHDPRFSDIDLTVYGLEATLNLKRAIPRMKEDKVINSFDGKGEDDWMNHKSKIFRLQPDVLRYISGRRWNYGVYEGTYFSVHPVRTDSEITEEYGDFTFKQKGTVSGEGEVLDSSDSIYIPAIYHVDSVSIEEGDNGVSEVVSYEALFCDMFEPGDRFEFKGILEEMGGKYPKNRVVIGGSGSKHSYLRKKS
jgi:predicted nucleotidyltransferase